MVGQVKNLPYFFDVRPISRRIGIDVSLTSVIPSFIRKPGMAIGRSAATSTCSALARVTITQRVTIQIPDGTTVLQAAMKLRVVSRDAQAAHVGSMNSALGRAAALHTSNRSLQHRAKIDSQRVRDAKQRVDGRESFAFLHPHDHRMTEARTSGDFI